MTKFILNLLSKLLSLPPSAIYAPLSKFLAIFFIQILGIRKKVMKKNLDIVFKNTLSEKEKMQIGINGTAAFFYTIFEFFVAPKLFPRIKTVWKNYTAFEKARLEKQGVYVLAIHQGNFELLSSAGSKTWGRVNIALKPLGGPAITAWVNTRRAELGVFEVPRKHKKPATHLMIELLKRGEILAVVGDQRRDRGVIAPLFGVDAATNSSILRLWKLHNAPIFPLIIKRTSPTSHECIFFDPLEIEDSESMNSDEFLIKNTIKLNQAIEKMILANPHEYFWLHDRFKIKSRSRALAQASVET